MDKIDPLTQNFISQQPIAALMHEYMKQSAAPTVSAPTAQYELANKPRYDITGERYGNTLSDDMFAIKNPKSSRHTPESYEYFANPVGNAGAYTPPTYDLPNPNLGAYMPQSEGDRPFGRKKFVTDDGSGVERTMSFWEDHDPPGELIAYWDALRNRQQVDALSTDNALAEKFGDVRSSEEPRLDANWDYYTDSLVNYDRLSGAQLEQLAKMGVNRPIGDEYDASADLMGLVNLYRRILGLK